jgi:hypothetical protein
MLTMSREAITITLTIEHDCARSIIVRSDSNPHIFWEHTSVCVCELARVNHALVCMYVLELVSVVDWTNIRLHSSTFLCRRLGNLLYARCEPYSHISTILFSRPVLSERLHRR